MNLCDNKICMSTTSMLLCEPVAWFLCLTTAARSLILQLPSALAGWLKALWGRRDTAALVASLEAICTHEAE